MNDHSRVVLGRPMTKSVRKWGGGRTQLHRPKPRQHCYQNFLSDMSDGSNDVGNDCSLQFAWMEKFHVSFDIPDRAIIFSLPPPVALMHIESNKGGATNNVNVSKDREKSPARDSNNDQSFSRENVSRTSVVHEGDGG